MASLGTWLTVAFAALWLGTLLAIATGFWASFELLATLLVLLVALFLIALYFHSRTLAAGSAVALLALGGVALATVAAPALLSVTGAPCT